MTNRHLIVPGLCTMVDGQGNGTQDNLDNYLEVFDPDQHELDGEGVWDTCDVDDGGLYSPGGNCAMVFDWRQEEPNEGIIEDVCK